MRTLIVVGVANTLTAAICFRFSRLAYRITLLLSASHHNDQRWQEQMHLAGCDFNVIVCDPHDASAVENALHTVSKEQPTTLILVRNRAAEQWLPQALKAHCLSHCERVICIQNDGEDLSYFEKDAVTDRQINMTFNTIRVGHIGASGQHDGNRAADLNAVNDEPPSLAMLNQLSGLPYEVAVLTAFLASDEAAHIDGAVIDVHSGRYFS